MKTALDYLDDLKDDAAVHIWPDDLAKCQTSECVVEVASVRLGSPDGKTVPLFSREQVAAALQWAASQQAAEGWPALVSAEVERATRKFPTWPTDPLHALAVLGEEFGELNKAMLQLTYEPHKTSPEEVRTEAIQTAAMSLRLAMSLERYVYAPCSQHSQQESPPSTQGGADEQR